MQLRQSLGTTLLDKNDKQEVREYLKSMEAKDLEDKMKQQWRALQKHVMSEQAQVQKFKNLVHKPKVVKNQPKLKHNRRKAIIVLNEDNEAMPGLR